MPILQFKQCFALVVEAQPDSQTWGKWPGGGSCGDHMRCATFHSSLVICFMTKPSSSLCMEPFDRVSSSVGLGFRGGTAAMTRFCTVVSRESVEKLQPPERLYDWLPRHCGPPCLWLPLHMAAWEGILHTQARASRASVLAT